MTPTDEEIRTLAHSLWELRGRRDGHDLDDWFDAEQDLLLLKNYEVIQRLHLDEPTKQFIGSREALRCRYCDLTHGDTTFSDESHALPKAFGNRSLIASDECDRCNKFFSETLEDSFDKLFMAHRTLLTIPGRRGVPSHKDKAVRIDYDSAGKGFLVKETGGEIVFEDHPDRRQLLASLTLQPYVPVRVLKCLAKMAVAIMPDSELPHFALTRKWLLERDDTKWLDSIGTSGCYQYLVRVPYPRPWAVLIRRRCDDTPLPYMMFLFGVSRLLLQAHVPLTPKDAVCVGRTVIVPRVGSFLFPIPVDNKWEHVPLATAALARDRALNLEISYRDLHVTDR